MVTILLVLVGLSMPSMSQAAEAHAPAFPGDNTSLMNATLVQDPSKSWAIYSHLEEGTSQYYALDLRVGDRLYLNLIAPTHERGSGFQPDMAILGPFADRNGTLPGSVEMPAGYGWKVTEGVFPSIPTYEPFSPGSFMNLATFDDVVVAGGRYYVVVYQDVNLTPVHGDYGLAVGYIESFTIVEFITIPISLLNVYQWEGQSLVQVFAPMAIVFLIGLFGLYLRRRQALAGIGVAQASALVAGLLFLSTASNTLIQTITALSQTGLVPEVLLTMIFIAAPLLLGWAIIRVALNRQVLTKGRRAKMFIFGLIGLVTWAGLIIGPIIAMVGSVLPGRRS
jgi:hypothetical protein